MTLTKRRRKWTSWTGSLFILPCATSTTNISRAGHLAYVTQSIPLVLDDGDQCIVDQTASWVSRFHRLVQPFSTESDRRLTDTRVHKCTGGADRPQVRRPFTMKSFVLCIAAIFLCICPILAGQTYSKSLDIIGAGFYDEFLFDNSADPTHGRVYAFSCSPSCRCPDRSSLLLFYQ